MAKAVNCTSMGREKIWDKRLNILTAEIEDINNAKAHKCHHQEIPSNKVEKKVLKDKTNSLKKVSCLYPTKLLKRLWVLNQFLNLISSCQQSKMICNGKWLKKLDVTCATTTLTVQRNARAAVNCSANSVKFNLTNLVNLCSILINKSKFQKWLLRKEICIRRN